MPKIRETNAASLAAIFSVVVLMFFPGHGRASGMRDKNKMTREISWTLVEHLSEDWTAERLSYSCELPADLADSPLAGI